VKQAVSSTLIKNSNRILVLVLLFFFTYCNVVKDIQRPSPLLYLLGFNQTGRIGIVSSDLGSAGRFSTMTPDGLSASLNYVSIHSDARAKYIKGKVYIINRLRRDNIQILNPSLSNITEMEFSTGQGTNPQDIAIYSDEKSYISIYEKSYLIIANHKIGQIVGRIDLSSFADSDGIPEISYLHIEDNSLYVFLQRLDRNSSQGIFPPSGYSSIIEIDILTEKILNEYKTHGKNPGSVKKMFWDNEPVLIYTSPGYLGFNYQPDGGVELFSLQTKKNLGKFLYSENTAGGDILEVEIKNTEVGYAKVQYPDFATSIHKFNPTTGEKISEFAYTPASDGYVSGMCFGPNGYLYLGSSNFSQPGISIYDTKQGDRLLNPVPISIGLRPIDIIYIP
jgi:hypothetical protein